MVGDVIQYTIKLNDVLIDGQCNWCALPNQPNDALKDLIYSLQVNLNSEEEDSPIWTLTQVGNFSKSSA